MNGFETIRMERKGKSAGEGRGTKEIFPIYVEIEVYAIVRHRNTQAAHGYNSVIIMHLKSFQTANFSAHFRSLLISQ